MGQCINCGNDTDNTVRISKDSGYCQSSSAENLCPKCSHPILIGDGWFVRIKSEVYHEYNADFGMFGFLERVNSKNDFDYLTDKRKYNFLTGVSFGR